MHPLAEWEQANPGTVHDPEWFGRDVLPRLASVKLSEIVEAAGLLEGVRVGHRAREVDAACFDVAGAGRGARRRGRARRSWAGRFVVVFVLLWPRLPLAPLPRWKDASSWPESTRPRSNWHGSGWRAECEWTSADSASSFGGWIGGRPSGPSCGSGHIDSGPGPVPRWRCSSDLTDLPISSCHW